MPSRTGHEGSILSMINRKENVWNCEMKNNQNEKKGNHFLSAKLDN